MTKEIPNHQDLLGQPLALGDAVVYPSSNSMYVGMITKINPKMIKVKRVGSFRWEQSKYPNDLVRVHGSEVTMYLLKNQKG